MGRKMSLQAAALQGALSGSELLSNSKAEMENRMVEAEAQARAALQACDKLQDLLKRSRERTVNAEVERDLCRDKLTIQQKEAEVKLSALAFDLNTLRDNVNEDFCKVWTRTPVGLGRTEHESVRAGVGHHRVTFSQCCKAVGLE